ncbi:MAG: efflux RND transporter periplasmic adaptor subunit [Desulfuromonadales bacterium]|nr:efflux RND transporter periplasmic adaptor subunit [Desulfuromonadales bacterium]MBN2792847.1 efflux RND transporter periplasmic adaptor subunit [Desulfuromonadales bacterium]
MVKKLVFAVSLLIFLISGHSATAAPEKKSSPPLVATQLVAQENINSKTDYVAHVEAVQAVDLQARVSGFLEQVNFIEGSNVRAGDLLYLIEPAPYKTKVAANRARVAKAQALLRKAEQQLARIRVVKEGAVPVSDIESAEAAEKQSRAELLEAEANLKLAEIDLAYTRITAPIDGRIGATKLTRGNLCGPTSGALARIVQLDPIRVQFSLSENNLKALRAARAATGNRADTPSMQPSIRLTDGRALKYSGRIDFVDNQVDPETGTISVNALFSNPEGELLPGQYVTLELSESPPKMLPVVPQAAVLEDREGRFVLIVDEQNRVEQRRITTGVLSGSSWAVEKGLAGGEQIIVQGLQKVKPGQQVKTSPATKPDGN